MLGQKHAAKLPSLKIVEYRELSASLSLFSQLFKVKTYDLSSKGGAEAMLPEYQLHTLLYVVRAEGGARAPSAPPWTRH